MVLSCHSDNNAQVSNQWRIRSHEGKTLSQEPEKVQIQMFYGSETGECCCICVWQMLHVR